MLLNVILYSIFNEFAFASYRESRRSESLEKLTSAPNVQQVRLHFGVIASVVIVIVAAIAAAVFIIRKYCCLQSNATYRYSELRQMQEQNADREEENDSDEDLLEWTYHHFSLTFLFLFNAVTLHGQKHHMGHLKTTRSFWNISVRKWFKMLIRDKILWFICRQITY